MVENTKPHNCRCIEARVGFDGENTLENILRRESMREPVDLLSIDIDGDDYHVFESLRDLVARVVICRYNPTIPPEMELVAARGNYFGCSALSLAKLAEKKGYKLAAVTNSNCIFVRAADFPRFAEYETSLPEIAVRRHLTYFISGYAGDYLLSREPTYGFGRPECSENHARRGLVLSGCGRGFAENSGREQTVRNGGEAAGENWKGFWRP